MVNVRGVETSYVNSNIKLEISKKSTIVTTIINFAESFFAFLIATFIIITASFTFPLYLQPICMIVMFGFGIYLYFE